MFTKQSDDITLSPSPSFYLLEHGDLGLGRSTCRTKRKQSWGLGKLIVPIPGPAASELREAQHQQVTPRLDEASWPLDAQEEVVAAVTCEVPRLSTQGSLHWIRRPFQIVPRWGSGLLSVIFCSD